MTIIVTGVAGFIGYHVSKTLLERGESIIGIDIINDYYDPDLKRNRLEELKKLDGDFQFLHIDFADYVLLKNSLQPLSFDRIIHLGAQAGVRYSIENPHAYIRANIMGHINLLEIARHNEVKHIVYASSSSVYGSKSLGSPRYGALDVHRKYFK